METQNNTSGNGNDNHVDRIKDKVQEFAQSENVQKGKEMASKKFTEVKDSMTSDFKEGGIVKLLKNKYMIACIACMLIVIVFFSCGSDGPPSSVIRQAITAKLTNDIYVKLTDYEIINSFKEEVFGKVIYNYDFKATLSTKDGKSIGVLFPGVIHSSGRAKFCKEGKL